MIAVTLAAELLLMNAIGACLRWKGMVDKEFSSRLTNLILNICVPCLIFQSINNAAEFSAEALKNCMVVLVLGVVAVAVPLLAGHLIYLATGKSGMGRNIRYGLTFYHFSFMGIPVIAELFGILTSGISLASASALLAASLASYSLRSFRCAAYMICSGV